MISVHFYSIADYKWSKETSFCCDSVPQTGPQTHILLIQIHEKYRNSPSKGGSSFTFIAKGVNTIDFCRVQDHFNGNYSVKCPLHENHIEITGKVNFVAFAAFSSGVKPLHKTVLNFEIRDFAPCPNKQLSMEKKFPQCKDWSAVDAVSSPGWWYKIATGTWSWYTGQCAIPKPSPIETATCFNSTSRVFFSTILTKSKQALL